MGCLGEPRREPRANRGQHYQRVIVCDAAFIPFVSFKAACYSLELLWGVDRVFPLPQ